MLKAFATRLRALLTRRRANAEADDEIAFHLDHETAANIARGMSPKDARRRALADLGGATQTREAIRSARTTWMDSLWRDVRYAVRSLRRAPVFTASAVLIMGTVVGVSGAAFSMADVIMWRALPYAHSEDLAQIVWRSRSPEGVGIGPFVNGRTWELLRDHAETVDVAVEASGGRVNFSASGTPALVVQTRVGAGYFRLLGISLVLGREFAPDEDRPGGPAVVLLDHAFWRRQFQSDPAVVGRTILLRGEPHQVVGVLSAAYFTSGERADVMTPVRPSLSGEGVGTNYGAIARLRSGYTWNGAAAEMQRLGSDALSGTTLPAGVTRTLDVEPLDRARTSYARLPLQLLLGSALTVLLIAGVNLSGLVLTRSAGRAGEMATRIALGSGRAALVQQLCVEHLILGIAGGAAGFALGAGSLSAAQGLLVDVLPDIARVTFDARNAAFTAVGALFFTVVFAAIPAALSTRMDSSVAWSVAGSRAVTSGKRHWTRRGLLGAQVALSVVLLIATGLLLRSLVNLQSLAPGLDADGVVATHASLQDARYRTAAAVNQLFDATLATLADTPGVEAAAVSLELPYNRLLINRAVLVGQTAVRGKTPMANFMYVTPDFFRALRIPLRRGRVFTREDRAGSVRVAVVNDAFARYIAHVPDPVGLQLLDGQEIVGLVGDVQVRNSGLGIPGVPPGPLQAAPIVFVPAAQESDNSFRLAHQWFEPYWTVRVRPGVSADVLLTRAIQSADPLLPLAPVVSFADLQRDAMTGQRSLSVLLSVFAGIALLLSATGIYGLTSQVVRERTRELAIRVALGATPGRTLRDAVGASAISTGAGVLAGIGIASLSTGTISVLLYRVDGRDLGTYTVCVGAIAVAATLASVVPALRVLRTDATIALRQ